MTTQVTPLKLNAGQVSELQSGDKVDDWVTPSGGSPGGSNTQVQFNNSNAFDGSSSLTWNGSTLSTTAIKVTISPTSGYVLTSDSSGNGTWQAATGGMAIGGPVTSGTSTYVLYVDGGNNLAQDANLTWDYANQIFHIAGAGTSNPALEVTSPTFAANFATENGGGFGSAGFFSVSSFDCFLAVNNNSDPECAAIFNDAANRIILCDGSYAARLTDGTRIANFIQSGANPIAYFYDGSNHNAAFCSPSYSGSFGSLTQSAVFCVSGSYAGQFSDGTHTATFCDGTNTIAYAASTPSDWAGSSPATDVWVALNRIAAALTGLSAPP